MHGVTSSNPFSPDQQPIPGQQTTQQPKPLKREGGESRVPQKRFKKDQTPPNKQIIPTDFVKIKLENDQTHPNEQTIQTKLSKRKLKKGQTPRNEQTIQTNPLKRKKDEDDARQERVIKRARTKNDAQTKDDAPIKTNSPTKMKFDFTKTSTAWTNVKLSIPDEKIESLEKACSEYHEIKKAIPISELLAKPINLKNLNSLLEFVNPVPVDKEVLDFELDILNRIKEVCACAKKNLTQFASIISGIDMDKKPSLLYEHASMMSIKTFSRIEEINHQKNLDENQVIENNDQIISLLKEEIERFSSVIEACRELEPCDIEAWSNCSVGESHKQLGLAYLKASKEDNKEGFRELALKEFKLAIRFFLESKNYYVNFPEQENKNEGLTAIAIQKSIDTCENLRLIKIEEQTAMVIEETTF